MAWQPTPVFLPGEPLGQRSLVSCVRSIASHELNTAEVICHPCRPNVKAH